MKVVPYLVVFALLAGPSVASGQGQQREEIIVTANRVAQPLQSAVASVTVIDRAAIARTMAQSLNELLLGRAGLHLAQSGGLGSQTSLFLRGTESDHTLVLIDGVSVNTSTGAAARLEQLALDQIDRIEIVRGPRSGVYGSEALGGVLQVFTRGTARDTLGGSASLSLGSERTGNAGLRLAGSSGGSSMAVGLSHRQSDGIDASKSGSEDRDGYRDDSVSVHLEQQLAAGSLVSLSLGGTDGESQYDDGAIEGRSRYLRSALLLPLGEAWSSELSIEEFREANENLGAYGDTASETRTDTLRWQNRVRWSEQSGISLGADYQRQRLDYESPGAVQDRNLRHNAGVYLGYLGQFAVMDVELAVRRDRNQRFGSHGSGSAGLGWQAGNSTRFRASYGTGFKAPSLLDLYVDFPDFGFFANPGLRPERSRALELGVQQSWGGALFSLSLFRNDISALITIDDSFTTLGNLDQARIDGLELSVAGTLAEWDITADLTWLDHRDRASGEELLRRPERNLRLSAMRRFGPLQVGFDVLAQDTHRDFDPLTFLPSRVPGYGIVSAMASLPVSDQLMVRLRAGNLFDKDYEVVDGYHSYGRSFLAALELSF